MQRASQSIKSNAWLKLPGIILFFIAIFLVRTILAFGRFSGQDEIQVYLIGLQSFTSEIYPYFGPDVVYSDSQIPGGLQGLLISLPLQLLKIPEAPYIFLNLLSFTTLVYFGWYLSKRIPTIPKPITYLWLLTCPWTLHYSTHIENPSYVLIGAVLFFTAVFELGNIYHTKILNKKLCFAFLGFSLFWIMQLHLSWVLMPPYILWVIWRNKQDKKLLLIGSLFFVVGASLSFSTLIPTLLLEHNSGGIENNLALNFSNILEIPTIILRFLSFASYEMTRFIGSNTSNRLAYIYTHLWASPFIFVLLVLGGVQVIYLIYSFFKPNQFKEWGKVKNFTIYSLLLVSCSFLFSISKPKSHTFYILFPVAMWYAFYCYSKISTKYLSKLATLIILSGLTFQVSLFIHRYKTESLFAHRPVITKAIKDMDYSLVGVRRKSIMTTANLEDYWTPIKDDKKEAYTSGFEINNHYFKPQNLVKNNFYEGKYSCKIDSIQRSGGFFKKSIKELNYPQKVNISFYAKVNDVNNFLLVCETRTKEGNFKESVTLGSKYQPFTKWQFLEFQLDVPATNSKEGELLIYLWMNNKSGDILNIDNITLKFE